MLTQVTVENCRSALVHSAKHSCEAVPRRARIQTHRLERNKEKVTVETLETMASKELGAKSLFRFRKSDLLWGVRVRGQGQGFRLARVRPGVCGFGGREIRVGFRVYWV